MKILSRFCKKYQFSKTDYRLLLRSVRVGSESYQIRFGSMKFKSKNYRIRFGNMEIGTGHMTPHQNCHMNPRIRVLNWEASNRSIFAECWGSPRFMQSDPHGCPRFVHKHAVKQQSTEQVMFESRLSLY